MVHLWASGGTLVAGSCDRPHDCCCLLRHAGGRIAGVAKPEEWAGGSRGRIPAGAIRVLLSDAGVAFRLGSSIRSAGVEPVFECCCRGALLERARRSDVPGGGTLRAAALAPRPDFMEPPS